MQYVVIELQDMGSTLANNVFAFNNVYDAEAKYHTLLSVAAKSSVPCHSAVMLNSEGMYVKSEAYKHGNESEE